MPVSPRRGLDGRLPQHSMVPRPSALTGCSQANGSQRVELVEIPGFDPARESDRNKRLQLAAHHRARGIPGRCQSRRIGFVQCRAGSVLKRKTVSGSVRSTMVYSADSRFQRSRCGGCRVPFQWWLLPFGTSSWPCAANKNIDAVIAAAVIRQANRLFHVHRSICVPFAPTGSTVKYDARLQV